MNEFVVMVAEWCIAALELLGIAAIMLMIAFALFRAAMQLFRFQDRSAIFRDLRQRVGRGILLGLEFLIAADIVYTVAVALTFESLGALAIIVLIRTFLSFALEMELTGRWPWQKGHEPDQA